MNIVVADYYGLLDRDKLDTEVDMSTAHALRALWVAGQGNTKVSHIHHTRLQPVQQAVSVLGGQEKASAALQEAKPWLEAWDEGERQGIELARATIRSHFDEAWVKQSAAANTPDPQDAFSMALHQHLRSIR